MTFEKYHALNKPGRTETLADNPALAAEFDNQLRNASHSRGMTFDQRSGLINNCAD